MAAISTTGTLTAGNSRTFALAPGSALTLTLLPNCRVTVTETPETVSASDAGGNSPRTHNHQLAGVVTYGPYAMGGSVVVENASNSGSTVTWERKDTVITTDSTGTFLVSGDGTVIELGGGGGGGSTTLLKADASTVTSIDASNLACLDLTMDASVSLVFSDVPAGLWQLRLIERQSPTGGHSITWPANTLWTDGTAPTQSLSQNAVDLYDLFTIDQGATWFGTQRYRGGAGATLLSDTVARGDSASSAGTCDTGQSWSALTGTWGVSSNKIYRVGITSSDTQLSIDVGAPWTTYSATVLHTAEFPGLAFDITDASNFYVVLATSAADAVNPRSLQIHKRVAGTYTLVGQSANNIFSNGTDLPITIVRNAGTRLITVKLSGTTVISATDASLAISQKVGMRLQTSLGTNAARWSAIQVS